MNMTRIVITAILILGAVNMSAYAATSTDRPVKMIFDTDMGNDIDDALALAMIHALADRGEVELLAVVLSKDNPWAAVYVDVINHLYGRPDIPVGTVRNGKTPEDGNYVRKVAERKVGAKFVYPRKLKSGADAPEAVGLLRKTLAAQPDGSVVLVSVGFLTNYARLLDSKPDAYSPLEGMELVKRKVREYVMMAGAFGPNPDGEYNVVVDADASRTVFSRWPTPIVASGFEIGAAILYPAESIDKDYGWAKDHPVAEAYRAYMEFPYDRPTWDLTAVLYAVRPDRGYFGLSPNGAISMDDKNVTRFEADRSGRHRFLTVTPEQITRVREACVFLASAPPSNLADTR